MQIEAAKLGLRVRVAGLFNDTGTIVDLQYLYHTTDPSVGIEFDTWRAGYTCSGLAKKCSGWYVKLEEIEVLSEGFGKVGTVKPILPTDAKERKKIPLASGLIDYFQQAFVEIAKVSYVGNEQHNPGQPMHWARGKSMDHADTMQRHFLERGTLDSDGVRHSAKMCWRALAILQEELEAEGYPLARGSKPAEKK